MIRVIADAQRPLPNALGDPVLIAQGEGPAWRQPSRINPSDWVLPAGAFRAAGEPP